MEESTAYQWAAQAIRCVEKNIKQHKWEQLLDNVASAVLEAFKEGKEGDKKDKKTCKIFGSEIEFNMDVKVEDIEKTCADIWNNPSKYSGYRDDSDDNYYNFLKFLWVRVPYKKDIRLADIVNGQI